MSIPDDLFREDEVCKLTENFFQLLGTWFGELGEFKPCIRWHRGIDRLIYLTKDCSYVADSFGWYFSVLLCERGKKRSIVGVHLEPFSFWVADIRKTYPGVGKDGRDFPLWPLVQLLTTEKCLFPGYSRKRVAGLLPKIRRFVSNVTIPCGIL